MPRIPRKPLIVKQKTEEVTHASDLIDSLPWNGKAVGGGAIVLLLVDVAALGLEAVVVVR